MPGEQLGLLDVGLVGELQCLFLEALAVQAAFVHLVSGGTTTRRPIALVLISTGASSRGTIFSLPSLLPKRSGTLVLPSVGGTTLVGLLSARMIGGSPLRVDTK